MPLSHAVLSTGTFTCDGTTPVVVANTLMNSERFVLVSLKTAAGTVGAIPAVKTITAGTGFTIAVLRLTHLRTFQYTLEL